MSKFNPVIKTCEDVTLIKLMNVPSDMAFIGEVFGKIAELSVDVNMISLSENSNRSVLAFTVKDNVQIMLITTSESQISVLVTRADFDDAVDSLSRQFV